MPAFISFQKSFLIFILPACCFFSGLFFSAYGQESADTIVWKSLSTKHTILRFQSQADLQKFHNKINFGPSEWGFSRFFSSTAPELAERVSLQVDLLFERVQDILDMRKKMDSVTINIHANREQLAEAYTSIYQKPCNVRAWYCYKNNTIYLSGNDLHEGMLAHELAHSIIDHYLLVRPPMASAEILARYVDSHLKD